MKEPIFTKGPWVAVTGDDPELMDQGRRVYFPHVELPGSGIKGARHNRLVINAGGFPSDVHDANARLIAAAPEMFYALREYSMFGSINATDVHKLLEKILSTGLTNDN